MGRTVAIVTMGCTRNEVDSEELAGRLETDGWTLVEDADQAEIAVINTCGFIESAKKDSIDALLEAHSLKGHGKTQAVVAVGCMAERYGSELAQALPEADAILGFDEYEDISRRLSSILSGEKHSSHQPRDRRALLPISPIDRPIKESAPRKRLTTTPWAPLKIASGCDRRCAFCAIPYFRGSFISRKPEEIIDEARWLAETGVSELFLVSENTTSYGKDLGDLRLMERLLPNLAAIDGIERIRLSYLQPAEMRPSLLQAMVENEKVSAYFDLSFQHASGKVLRSMRRFGDGEKFLHLISQVRALSPEAGIRSNFIVGFPGETHEEYKELVSFISEARLDAIGIFGYSDEDETEALTMAGKVDEATIAHRVSELSRLSDQMVSERARQRIGERVRILVEDLDLREGRTEFQGPDVDGTTTIIDGDVEVGDYLSAVVVDAVGADLVAEVR